MGENLSKYDINIFDFLRFWTTDVTRPSFFDVDLSLVALFSPSHVGECRVYILIK